MPSLRSGHYSLGAFGPLNPIETLESASNYYIDTFFFGSSGGRIDWSVFSVLIKIHVPENQFQ